MREYYYTYSYREMRKMGKLVEKYRKKGYKLMEEIGKSKDEKETKKKDDRSLLHLGGLKIPKGTIITVYLNNNSGKITGKLENITKYEILLSEEGSKDITILFKHAISEVRISREKLEEVKENKDILGLE